MNDFWKLMVILVTMFGTAQTSQVLELPATDDEQNQSHDREYNENRPQHADDSTPEGP